MNIPNKCILAITILLGCTLTAANADATVCFAADGACGGTAGFSDYVDPEQETTDECAAIGYDMNSTDCLNEIGKQIGGYCPYNNSRVVCCGLDYAYSQCAYPHVPGDAPVKCGSKNRCKCDPDTYKYSSISACVEANYINSMPGGASCSYIKSVDGSGNLSYELAYKSCTCDRGLYPYSENDCEATGSSASGNFCQASEADAEGASKYYASCVCDRILYPESNESCEFGGSDIGGYCVQSGMTFFKGCCSCNGYPAEGTRDKGPNDPNVDKSRELWIWDVAKREWIKKAPATSYTTVCTEASCRCSYAPGNTSPAKFCERTIKERCRSSLKRRYCNIWTYKEEQRLKENLNLPENQKIIWRNTGYDTCPCVKGYKRFKITKCNEGWRPSKANEKDPETGEFLQEGEKCLPISCEAATKLFLAKGPSSAYSLYKGSPIPVTYTLRKDSDGEPILDTDGTYTYNEIAKTSSTYLIFEGQTSIGYCSWGKGIGCTGKTYHYSAQYLGSEGNSKYHKILQQSCKAPAEIVYTGTTFPAKDSSDTTLYIYGINIKFNNTYVNRPLSVTNAKLYTDGSKTVQFTSDLNLSKNSFRANSENTIYAISTTIMRQSKLTATGYNFTVNDMLIETSTTASNSEKAKFTFEKGQSYVGSGTFFFYPAGDRRKTNLKHYVTFEGPLDGRADIRTNLYVGYNNNSSTAGRDMKVNLTNGIDWYLYGSQDYVVGLSTSSSLTTSDGASIKRSYNPGTNTYSTWSQCTGRSYQDVPERYCRGRCFGAGGCASGSVDNKNTSACCCCGNLCSVAKNENIYVFCTVNKNNYKTDVGYSHSYKTESEEHSANRCDATKYNVGMNSGCVITMTTGSCRTLVQSQINCN